MSGPFEIAIISALVAGIVSCLFGIVLDREQKRRDVQTQYLLEAYRNLELAGRNELTSENAARIERAIADIQLLGTPKQIELAQCFASDFAGTGGAQIDHLLLELRTELRKELHLKPVAETL
jgi:type II secretory pathway pseudopilin PulG